MKFAAIIVLSLMMTSAFATELARMVTKTDGDAKAKIIALFTKESKKPGSAIAKLMEKIKKDNDIPESGSISLPTVNDVMWTMNGKGGYGLYGTSYLVGIPCFRKGTGMIEEYASYVTAHVETQLEIKDTVIINNEVKIIDVE